MIDPDWFARTCCIAQASLGERDAETLCAELGVQEEVLPYLLIAADGFTDWPLARETLRAAVRSVPRGPGNAIRQSAGAHSGPLRSEMRSTILAMLYDSAAVAGDRDETTRQRAAAAITRHASAAGGEARSQASYISGE